MASILSNAGMPSIMGTSLSFSFSFGISRGVVAHDDGSETKPGRDTSTGRSAGGGGGAVLYGDESSDEMESTPTEESGEARISRCGVTNCWWWCLCGVDVLCT